MRNLSILETLFACVLGTSISATSAEVRTVQVGHPPRTASELNLSPTEDPASGTGYRIPATVKAAVAELGKMLSDEDAAALVSKSVFESDFLSRPHFLEISIWIEGHWLLDDEASALGKELHALGFGTPGWRARALLELVYEQRTKVSGSQLHRLQRFAYLEQEDALLPLTPPPTECASEAVRVQSMDLDFDKNDGWPYGRGIYWVDCRDGSKRAYQWEREWFIPDPALAKKLINRSPSAIVPPLLPPDASDGQK